MSKTHHYLQLQHLSIQASFWRSIAPCLSSLEFSVWHLWSADKNDTKSWSVHPWGRLPAIHCLTQNYFCLNPFHQFVPRISLSKSENRFLKIDPSVANTMATEISMLIFRVGIQRPRQDHGYHYFKLTSLKIIWTDIGWSLATASWMRKSRNFQSKTVHQTIAKLRPRFKFQSSGNDVIHGSWPVIGLWKVTNCDNTRNLIFFNVNGWLMAVNGITNGMTNGICNSCAMDHGKWQNPLLLRRDLLFLTPLISFALT